MHANASFVNFDFVQHKVKMTSAARMPVIRPTAPEYINIYILFIISVVKHL